VGCWRTRDWLPVQSKWPKRRQLSFFLPNPYSNTIDRNTLEFD
jgi:hypothetical protein